MARHTKKKKDIITKITCRGTGRAIGHIYKKNTRSAVDTRKRGGAAVFMRVRCEKEPFCLTKKR